MNDQDLIRLSKYVVRAVNLTGSQAAMREDCEQEAYLEGLRGIRGAEAKGQKPAFHHIMARMTKAVYRIILAVADQPLSNDQAAEPASDPADAKDFAKVALAILSDNERCTLMSYLTNGAKETAILEGISAKGVYYRVARAIAKIRALQAGMDEQ